MRVAALPTSWSVCLFVLCYEQDDLSPLPMPSTPPDTSAGFAFNLWNNAWGTNYVMYYPFDEASSRRPEDRDMLFRFQLTIE